MESLFKIWFELGYPEEMKYDLGDVLFRLITLVNKLENHPLLKEDFQIQKEEDLLDTAALAKALNKSESTIHNWKRLQLIPFERIGRSVFYKKSDVLDALKKIPAKSQRLERKPP